MLRCSRVKTSYKGSQKKYYQSKHYRMVPAGGRYSNLRRDQIASVINAYTVLGRIESSLKSFAGT